MLFISCAIKKCVFHVLLFTLHLFVYSKVVRLEGLQPQRIRYLVLVTFIGVEDTEENVILGVDIWKKSATIGLVVPVWADTEITLNGDG